MQGKRRKMDELFAALNSEQEKKATAKNKFSLHPVAKEEKIRDIYAKMLCLVLQYEENMTVEQQNYMTEFLEGVGTEYDLNGCLDLVMEITPQEFQSFLQELKENGWGVNFSMDMLQLVAAGNEEELQQVVDKLIETLEIEEEEEEYLEKICESIQRQSVALYIEAEENRPKNIKWERFSFYVADFVEGIRQGVVAEAAPDLCLICNYSEEKADITLEKMSKGYIKIKSNEIIRMANVLKSKKIVLKNLRISGFFEMGLYFDGCEDVLVENCEFVGDRDYLRCSGCQKVVFLGCHFYNFKSRIFDLEKGQDITFESCIFEDCTVSMLPLVHVNIKRGNYSSNDVFWESTDDTKIAFKFSTFNRCWATEEAIYRDKNKNGYTVIISDFASEIQGCTLKFYDYNMEIKREVMDFLWKEGEWPYFINCFCGAAEFAYDLGEEYSLAGQKTKIFGNHLETNLKFARIHPEEKIICHFLEDRNNVG